MNSRNLKFWVVAGFACTLIAGLLTGLIFTKLSSNQNFNDLARIIGEVSDKYPALEDALVQAVKTADISHFKAGSDILRKYGYRTNVIDNRNSITLILQCIVIWIIIYLAILFIKYIQMSKTRKRILGLTQYLYSINTGAYCIITRQSEDDFSILEDELCKTVVELKQTREKALKAKKSLADNLSDIAHQIKTPLTSMSLMTELLAESGKAPEDLQYVRRIQNQLNRLEKLVGDLLTLSRLDAGTLVFENTHVDVFTLISAAVDAIGDITRQRQQSVIFNEKHDISFYGDFSWSVEAIINIIKNCSEHSREKSTIKIRYDQNPIYTNITVEDDGEGFAKEDIPHIFERFYRGKNSVGNSTGIGLALSKAIIEGQNGTITAENNKSGGAVFNIKFYNH